MLLLYASALLAGVLAFAVGRPRGLPEATVAVPAAVVVVATGLLPWRDALADVRTLGPTVGFLAAVLLFAHPAGEHGVFRYAGALTARISGRSPSRLLTAVFVVASLTTAVLSLDATTLLWRQILHSRDAPPDGRDFLELGLVSVLAALVAGVLALWLSLALAEFWGRTSAAAPGPVRGTTEVVRRGIGGGVRPM